MRQQNLKFLAENAQTEGMSEAEKEAFAKTEDYRQSI